MGHVLYGLASGDTQAEAIVKRLDESGVPLDAVSVLVRDPRGPMLHPGSAQPSGRTIGTLAIVPVEGLPGFLGAGLVARLSHARRIDVAARLRDDIDMPAADAERYERELGVGKILIAVHTDNPDHVRRASAVLESVQPLDPAIGETPPSAASTRVGGRKPAGALHGLWSVRGLWHLLKTTGSKWNDDKAPRLGAALAYYTVFSLAPLLVIIIGIAGLVFGKQAAEGAIVQQISGLVGGQSAAAIQTMLANARTPSSGGLAAIIGVVTLLVGASGLFGQLQDALNTIWGVEPKPGRGVLGMLKDRFVSFVALLGTAFLLLVSLVVSAAIAAAGTVFKALLPAPEAVLHLINLLVSLTVITGLFAMMFKVLPDVKIAWRDVWLGAAVTALLFAVGKYAIALYLGKSDVGSAYGAAGSLVIILVWVYYSAQILLFGAEFTAVYANEHGSRIVPADNAQPAGARSPAA
jgi:membrane protein